MRIDPTEVFTHTIASIPLRVCLAWMAGTLGAFTPIFIGHGFGTFGIIGWQLLFFPFYLFLVSLLSGWWAYIAFPLLIVLIWRLFVFLREESTSELFWMFIMPFLIGIRVSGQAWPLAALLAGVAIFFFMRRQRRYN